MGQELDDIQAITMPVEVKAWGFREHNLLSNHNLRMPCHKKEKELN